MIRALDDRASAPSPVTRSPIFDVPRRRDAAPEATAADAVADGASPRARVKVTGSKTMRHGGEAGGWDAVRASEADAAAPPPARCGAHCRYSSPALATLPVADVRSLVAQLRAWSTPAVAVYGEPSAHGLLHAAAATVAREWPWCCVVWCPMVADASGVVACEGTAEDDDARESRLHWGDARRLARPADAEALVRRACLDASLCNRLTRAAAVPARARALVIDGRDLADRDIAVRVRDTVGAWRAAQRQTVLFTADLADAWCAQAFGAPGEYVWDGARKKWRG